MPVKKRFAKARAHKITPELLPKVKRLLELSEAHIAAIQGGDQSFYSDGRHEELQALVSETYPGLGIGPWDDDIAKLNAALEAR